MTDLSATVRRIQPDEWAGLRAVRLRALADSPEAFNSTFEETLTRPPDVWQQRAADGAAGRESVMLVAEANDSFVGMAGGLLEEDRGVTVVTLISMWVDPAYRRLGVGQRLVEEIVAWARERGVRRVYLLVHSDNDSAERLYRRCGFRHTGEVEEVAGRPGRVCGEMVLDIGVIP